MFTFDERDDGPVKVTQESRQRQLQPFSTADAGARAVFGQATYDLSRRIAITAGLRYSRERKGTWNRSGLYHLGTMEVADPTFSYDMTDTATFDAWTPRVAVQFQASDARMVYWSVTRGFKSGGFNPTTRVRGGAFRPEFGWSHETGWKQQIGRRARANVAAFYNDYRDLQVLTFVTTGVLDTRNAASATIVGIEGEVSSTWANLQLAASGSIMRATYDRYIAVAAGGRTADVAGNTLNNAPAWSGYASATYSHPAFGGRRTFIRGDLHWQSRVFFTPFNDAVETQGEYALAHLRAGVAARSGRWDVALYVRNIFNQVYFTGTLNQPDLPAILARPGAPRQWGTQLTVRK